MDVRRRMLFKKKQSSSGGSTSGGSYTVNLNGQWEQTTAVSNPDSTLYDGVYRSASNYNVNSGVATMYITIKDCSSFKMYIRSYAESSWDYVMVSQLDKTITGNSSYSDTTLVKAHTRGNQQSGTSLSSYTMVEFTGISSGQHTITVVYRKDSSVNNGDDRGYVLIEKSQAGNGESGGGSNEGLIDINNYLTIEALEDGLTAQLSKNTVEYCVDGDGNWKSLPAGTATKSVNTGHTLSFRGNNLTPNSSYGIGTFTVNKNYNLKGNVMSMLFGDMAGNNFSLNAKNYAFYKLFYNNTKLKSISPNFLPATILARYCYYCMFYGCTSLTTTPKLSAMTLEGHCYYSMFYGCTSLTTTPELPATTLAERCYYSMFNSCRLLTRAPELPAKTLKYYCYSYMFQGCTSLTTAPELPATTLVDNCYDSMFYNCTSLTRAPELPAKTLKNHCYSYMFYGCASLTTAPELPATTLATHCYSNMFQGCASLTTTPKLSAMTLEGYCYSNMFYGCTSLTTTPILPATTLVSYCYHGMFQNCTLLTTVPILPATTLVNNCYYYMFYGCSKINYIKMLATDISASRCLYNWVYNVPTSGTFVKHPNMTTLPTATSSNSYAGIPEGWTVVNDGEEGNSNLITFTIDGTEYQAEEGMTWEEFCNSEYNINSFHVIEEGGNSQIWCDGGSHVSASRYVYDIVLKDDLIINNYAYYGVSDEPI